jgi:hypothetical protein
MLTAVNLFCTFCVAISQKFCLLDRKVFQITFPKIFLIKLATKMFALTLRLRIKLFGNN